MATGTISSLGVGSGLELQDILDQLRGVDEQTITLKEEKVADLEVQLNEFTVVNNKLLTMKSTALDLSLSSTFLGRTVTSSNEGYFTATVADGTAVQTTSVTVDRLATKSSWLSGGMSATNSIVYVPTTQESTTGVADPNATVIAAADGNMVISFGSTPTTITVPVGPASTVDTLNELVNAINTDPENVGGGTNGRLVTASTYVVGGDTYLRIASDFAGGTGEANRVKITTNATTLAMAPPNKTFAYQVGSDTITVSVAADTTLSGLASLINNDTDNPGVTASVIDSGAATNPYKLVLQANNAGEDNRISILAQMPDLTLTEQQGALGASLNAQVTISGISYQRQTNTIGDVLSGITLNLVSAGTASVSVTNNNDGIKELISELITAYNDVVQEINSKVAYDEDAEEFGILAGTTVRDLPYALQNLMTSRVTTGSNNTIKTLFNLGLEFNRDGTITLNEATLDDALESYSSEVQAFFLGDEDADVTGLGDLLNEYLREVTGGNGQLAAEKTAAQAKIDDMELRIEADTERLDKKYELLAKQFIELDRYMNQMKSISSYLTGQFDSLSGMLSGSKK